MDTRRWFANTVVLLHPLVRFAMYGEGASHVIKFLLIRQPFNWIRQALSLSVSALACLTL